MVAAIAPVLTNAAVATAATELSLSPGAVIDAQVVKVLNSDAVQIALQGILIDALSEVPLQAGQNLKLVVSQTPQGVRLSILPPSEGSHEPSAPAAQTSSPPVTTRTVAQPSTAPITVRPSEPAAVTAVAATPETQAIAVATQTAAARQSGLSQLFANLTVAANNDSLPKALRQAAAQVIALRPALDETISGPQLRQAVATSGLFREASLSQGQQPASNVPDIKSALIVLRQIASVALADALESLPPQTSAGAQAQIQSQPEVVLSSPSSIAPTQFAERASITSFVQAQPSAGSTPPQREQDITTLPDAIQSSIQTGAKPSNAIRADALTDLVRHLVTSERGALDASSLRTDETNSQRPGTPRAREAQADVTRTNIPPPPFRAAAPSAQAVVPPTLAPDTPAAVAVKRIVDETDGAIARQTLLQIASLPERTDLPSLKSEMAQPRWAFEIPFATPQGTAVAQFEIAREGGGDSPAVSAGRIWRARFSLDVEPAGPVHAIVSLAGETTSVRMWAERPTTAARLRAGTMELAQALKSAALLPGDIVIERRNPDAGSQSCRRSFHRSRLMKASGTKSRVAVALEYDRMGAPRVIAKGRGALGEKIVDIAKAHDIPIEENEVLAGALSKVELGDEIPEELYRAIAEVLIFVLRLSKPIP